jgi:hypothetical protein
LAAVLAAIFRLFTAFCGGLEYLLFAGARGWHGIGWVV